jgi:hypothetical protein
MRLRAPLVALLVAIGLTLPGSAKSYKPKKIKNTHAKYAKSHKYKARKVKRHKVKRH